MKLNLIINYYNEKNAERKSEIDFCVKTNAENREIDKLYVILSSIDGCELDKIDPDKRGIRIFTDKRPTYNDFFEITRYNPSDINVFCNTDIFFDSDSIKKIKSFNWTTDVCFALSRWDVTDVPISSVIKAELFDREDSQDTWIFKGGIPFIKEAEFTPGIAGCDNAIAFVLKKHGYSIWNPSQDIKTFHYHITNLRSYVIGRPKTKIAPPYHYIKPCSIEQVKIKSFFSRLISFELKQLFYQASGRIVKNKQHSLNCNA